MSTRAIFTDGTRACYLHHDGYPPEVIKTLQYWTSTAPPSVIMDTLFLHDWSVLLERVLEGPRVHVLMDNPRGCGAEWVYTLSADSIVARNLVSGGPDKTYPWGKE